MSTGKEWCVHRERVVYVETDHQQGATIDESSSHGSVTWLGQCIDQGQNGASRYVCKADRAKAAGCSSAVERLLLLMLQAIGSYDLRASVAKPVVCNTPLGLPVLPEVYKRNKGSSAFIHSTCKNNLCHVRVCISQDTVSVCNSCPLIMPQ